MGKARRLQTEAVCDPFIVFSALVYVVKFVETALICDPSQENQDNLLE
jgi:hypothetical protein